MITLGIETAGRVGGIALLSDGASVATRSFSKHGQRHAQALVKEVMDLLAESHLKPEQVELLAVSIGPGSFTGLRVGVVFAKTWCYATGAKLTAVDTLQASAVRVPGDVPNAYAIADAQRGDVYVGRYRTSNPPAGWNADDLTWRTPEDAIATRAAREFAESCDSNDCITGPALEKYKSLFADSEVAESALRHPTAESVARIGCVQAAAGNFADLWTIEPFYIRKSAAEEKLEKRS